MMEIRTHTHTKKQPLPTPPIYIYKKKAVEVHEVFADALPSAAKEHLAVGGAA